jgi:hypothetical protein
VEGDDAQEANRERYAHDRPDGRSHRERRWRRPSNRSRSISTPRLSGAATAVKPTETMIDAAHGAVWFDAEWAINNRRDFKKAVRAMVEAAMKEGTGGR